MNENVEDNHQESLKMNETIKSHPQLQACKSDELKKEDMLSTIPPDIMPINKLSVNITERLIDPNNNNKIQLIPKEVQKIIRKSV